MLEKTGREKQSFSCHLPTCPQLPGDWAAGHITKMELSLGNQRASSLQSFHTKLEPSSKNV